MRPRRPLASQLLGSTPAIVLVGVASAVCPLSARAEPVRALTLYPENDLRIAESSSPSALVSGTALLTQTTVRLGLSRCVAQLTHVPLTYMALQVGVGCALEAGNRYVVGAEVLAEGAYRSSNRKGKVRRAVRPGALPALRHTFHLVDAANLRVLTIASLSYKVVARESRQSEEDFARPSYNPFYIQRWADVLESNYALGLLTFLPVGGSPERLAVRIQYLETLPLGLRRWGGLADSASVQYKQVDVNARMRFGSFLAGAGVGYAVLTFDGIRVGIPLPALNAGFLW